MKLLFYIHAISGGGAERVLVNLVNELIERGHDITVATDTSRKDEYGISDKVKLLNLYDGCAFPANTRSKRIGNYFRRFRNIRKIKKAVKPDVIISFIRELNLEVTISLLFTNTPIIGSEHITLSNNFSKRIELESKLLFPRMNAITILTKTDYAMAKKKMSNVVHMPNPIVFNKANDENIIREKRVLAIGRIDAWNHKGFDNLIKYWSEIQHEFPEWKLEIAGNGQQKSFDYLLNLIKEHNCKNIELLGFRNDINDLIAQSEVFVLSSRREGLPMALIESMAGGCACIAFDCKTGPNEIITNNVNGILVRDQNGEDFKNSLRKVLSDDALRAKLSTNAPSVIKKFSPERIADRWEILFNKLIAK